ncbi:hypothetical protein CY34DRAFT_491426 [Suillus luteus UH-Slu-Lm8-n1]|uniref:Uncharacterized protein n=1 Tax=Suillus luteus UH-Slu-Lm8-n1 TaxID=930992 RepID=A0A0D0AY50_9AGAM|nr:hypothetical protein CY34DRAFT_491426 [Suillus luteus UH-Slu-Lm8-n1]
MKTLTLNDRTPIHLHPHMCGLLSHARKVVGRMCLSQNKQRQALTITICETPAILRMSHRTEKTQM